jgi:hypothetical protein
MKKYLFILLVFYINTSYSQINTLQVIGASGSNDSNGNIQLDWTVGETIINIGSNSNNILTQGFNQSVLLITDLEEIVKSSIMIQPNPTSDYLILNIPDKELNDTYYSLIDINGKVILEDKIKHNQTRISFIDYSKSIYFFNVFSKNEMIKTFRVIKE